jgi:hypothetical protein
MSGVVIHGISRDTNSRGKLKRNPRRDDVSRDNQPIGDVDLRAADPEPRRMPMREDDVPVDDVDSLRLKLEAKERDFEELSKQLTQMTARLLQHSQPNDAYQRDDTHFQKSFDALAYKINDWTTLNFTVDVTGKWISSPSKPLRDPFDGLYDNWEGLVKTPETRLLAIQEFVWDCFSTNLFAMTTKTGALWAGDMRTSFLRLADDFDNRDGKSLAFNDARLPFLVICRAVSVGLTDHPKCQHESTTSGALVQCG